MSGTTADRPLRILQVASGCPRWGGAELHLVQLAHEQQKRGHDVQVVCQQGKFVEAEAAKRGLRTVPITVRGQWDFKEAGKFRRLLTSQAVDVLHVHWSTDYVVGPSVARACRMPAIVMSRHSPYPLKSKLSRFLYDRVLFDRAIAVSESVRRTLIGSGMSASKVATVYHGTDIAAFRQTTKTASEVRAEWGLGPESILVGMVGRIAEEKGWRMFLEAFASIPVTRVRAVFIGDGPDTELAKARAEELGIADRVTFAGFQSDINNAVNALDIHVLASTWAEPCAAVVQQAMALEKPVIGTDTGGTPEMVVDGVTGLLVPPGDAPALACAIKTLALDAACRARFGRAGRERAEARFTLAQMTDGNIAVYRDILTKTSA